MRDTKAKNEILRRAYTRCLKDYYSCLATQQLQGKLNDQVLLEAEDLVAKLRRIVPLVNLHPTRLAA